MGGHDESYNRLFSLHELENALRTSKHTAPGEDRITYSMICNCPDITKRFILSIFNKLWCDHTFPIDWLVAIVLPFLKPGKPSESKKSYRPISLTQCLCKVLERMVNVRLVWTLEKDNFLSTKQYGFRRCRSTTDVLVRLDTAIKTAFARKQHTIAVFLDLEKAYDTAWRQGILAEVHRAGIRGHMAYFLINFLSCRSFKVKVGSSMSDSYTQFEGVPQGSVLSCTLFSLAINGITSGVPDSVDCTLYVDDFTLFASSSNLNALERRLQLSLNSAFLWLRHHGFTVSEGKTVVMHFCKLRGNFPEPTLFIGQSRLPVVGEVKFLGMVLDPKLSFIPHLRQLKDKCLKAMGLLKTLSHYSWGADRISLLRIYRSLIRSKLDYGCQIYCSTPVSYLKIIHPIHHLGIRLSTGAFRTSPVHSLYADSGEPPLSLRWEKLSLQLYVRILGMPDTPAYVSVANVDGDRLFEGKKYHTTFGYRVRNLVLSLSLPDLKVLSSVCYMLEPWTLPLPKLCAGIHGGPYSKASTPPALLRQCFLDHVRGFHSHHTPIYTDGSKTDDSVGFAVVFPNLVHHGKLPQNASIFSAELQSILASLAILFRQPSGSYVVFSDSLSALQAITNSFCIHPIVLQIHHWLYIVSNRGYAVDFCWVPAHVNVSGNERADREAAIALLSDLPVPSRPLPVRDYYPLFRSALFHSWNQLWADQTNNKLHKIKSTAAVWGTSIQSQRKHEVLLARLRIGHTRLTHSFLLEGGEIPYCEHCIVPLSVEHLLCECPEFSTHRLRSFGVDGIQRALSLSRVLGDDSLDMGAVVSFLQDTGLFHLL